MDLKDKIVLVVGGAGGIGLGIGKAFATEGCKVALADTDEDGFIKSAEPKLAPCRTHQKGIFVAGTAAGPKDIPDSIVEAGAAAIEAAVYLQSITSKAERE